MNWFRRSTSKRRCCIFLSRSASPEAKTQKIFGNHLRRGHELIATSGSTYSYTVQMSAYLLEGELFVRDLEEDLDAIYGSYDGLGKHTREAASQDALQSHHDIVAMML